MRSLVAVLVLCAAAPAEPAKADFGAEALRARVTKLQPAVEKALGARFGNPVVVDAVDPAGLAKAGVPAAETGLRLAVTDWRAGRILVCPKNIARIAALDPGWSDLLAQDALDALLVRELVAVWQRRQLGAGFLDQNREARTCLLRGHARHVLRAVARALALDAGVEALQRARTGWTPGLGPAATDHLLAVQNTGLERRGQEGEVLYDAVVKAFEEGDAWHRVAARPPDSLATVRAPDRYVRTLRHGFDLDRAARAVERLLAESLKGVTIAAPNLVHRNQVLLALGAEARALDRRHARGATLVRGLEPLTSVLVRECSGADGAKALYALEQEFQKKEDELIVRANEGNMAIKADAPRKLDLDGSPAVLVTKSVTVGGWEVNQAHLAIAQLDDLLVRLDVVGDQLDARTTLRTLRLTLALLRGRQSKAPWEGSRGEALFNAFAVALDDADWGVRWRAARNLGRLHRDGEAICTVLQRALDDAEPEVRRAAFESLVVQGGLDLRSCPRIAASPHADVRTSLYRALADAEQPVRSERIALLAKGLTDDDADARATAATSLETLGAGKEVPFDRVLPLVANPGPARGPGLELLAAAELEDERERAAGDALLAALGDENDDVRARAADLLGGVADATPGAVKALGKALEDHDFNVRLQAVYALLNVEHGLEDALPGLVAMLGGDTLADVAARVAGRLGPAGKPAVPALKKMLASNDRENRFAAALALMRIEGETERYLPHVAEMLRDGEGYDRNRAARALGEIGAAAAPFVKDLIAVLADDDLRRDAARALGNIGPPAREALPALRKLADGDDDVEAWLVQDAIEKIEGKQD